MASERSIVFSNITCLLEKHNKLVGYFFVGATAAIIDLCIFFSCVYIFQFSYFYAGILGFTVATFVNYLFCIKFVFINSSRFKRRHQILGIYLVSAIGLLMHQFILYSGIELAQMHIVLTKFIASSGVFFWNYWGRSHVIFKKEPEQHG